VNSEIESHTIDVEALLAQLTLEEKVALCSGRDFWHLESIPRLGIPSLMMADGPHGLRKQREDDEGLGLTDSVPATCFPSAVTLASTWNRDLLRQGGGGSRTPYVLGPLAGRPTRLKIGFAVRLPYGGGCQDRPT
jgi:beta-glucosidase-like glycosyl hydrolase